ncbi:hypothetical protein CAL18_00270 [Bordetella genomosp. 7]|uniref:hypothetical protein n=1 Tax=Bordetella genomosp. 7 TaxID=1416805 RepID=UPI000B9DD704|nr:hypothetical protein [Bordetella genomosp. 7]OZI29390.1 hypothetical protein CAL18_00270 [Bordetella genomosp. 7]
MSELTLNSNARLTDALERDLLRGAMEAQSNAQPLVLLKQAAGKIARAGRAFANYVAEVNDTMNRARAASAHYTGSQW